MAFEPVLKVIARGVCGDHDPDDGDCVDRRFETGDKVVEANGISEGDNAKSTIRLCRESGVESVSIGLSDRRR